MFFGKRIELKGRAATVAVCLVFALLFGNLFLPRVLAMTGLRTGYTYRLWNSGHSERHVGTDGGLFLGIISRSGEQSIVIPIPEDGIYSVYVSPMGFGGSVEFDWSVES